MQNIACNDYERKLDELDCLLNDPDVPFQPALVWRVVDEVAECGSTKARSRFHQD
jgi:hypothetical protein